MHFFPNSDGARESGKKPLEKKPAKSDTGIGGASSTGKVDDVLTRLNEAVLKALATGATKVDGKEIDHAQAEELRQLLGQGYGLQVTTIESLSHVSKAKGGDEIYARGWNPETSSRLTLQAIDQLGQPVGTYGLSLTISSGRKAGAATSTTKKAAQTTKKAAQKAKTSPKEANTAGSSGFLLRSGFSGGRRRV